MNNLLFHLTVSNEETDRLIEANPESLKQIDELSKNLMAILRTPEITKQFFDLGAEPVGDTPEQFARFIQEEGLKWAKVARTNNIKLQ